MAVEWIPHRFSGGALALDVTNTVVLRGDPERSFDRFDDPAEIARFAEAATRHRAKELSGRTLAAPQPAAIATSVLTVRETTDRLFRRRASDGEIKADDMPSFLTACASALEGSALRFPETSNPFQGSQAPIPFEAAVALSALSLLHSSSVERIRICANCRWLFLDESRNRSRIWCDMAVCGNRRKAHRYYHRRKGEDDHA
jgi:predicted RNA-binding Zn ribbon-like protein